MGNWSLAACLLVIGLGALVFLRLVSAEIDLIESEADRRRQKQMINQRRQREKPADLEPGA